MAMNPTGGSVDVDDSGNETYSPNDATNMARAFYLMLLGVNSHGTKDSKVSGGPAILNPDGSITPPPPATTVTIAFTIEPTPAIKKKTAEMANGFASVIVPYLIANAEALIPATPDGDGLMRDSGSADCLGPLSPTTLRIQ